MAVERGLSVPPPAVKETSPAVLEPSPTTRQGPPARSATSRRTLVLLRVGTTLLVAVFLYFAARRMDLVGFRRALGSASFAPLLLASLLNLLLQLARAGYWTAIVRPISKVPLGTMYRYTLAAAGASLVLPARGGEALRVWWLHKRHGIALGAVAAAFAFEKTLDVVTLTLVVSPMPWLLSGLAWLRPVRIVAPLALVGGLAIFLVARGARRRVRWLAEFHMFDQLRYAGIGLALVTTAWLIDISVISLVMHSVSIPVQLAPAMLVLWIVNLTVAIPAAPGNIGTLEIGATFALTSLGVLQERAAAFAVLYHATQAVPLLIASGLVAPRLNREH